MGHLSLGRQTSEREALHRAVVQGCVAGSFVKSPEASRMSTYRWEQGLMMVVDEKE